MGDTEQRRRGHGYVGQRSDQVHDVAPNRTMLAEREGQLGQLVSTDTVADRLGVTAEDLQSMVQDRRLLRISIDTGLFFPRNYFVEGGSGTSAAWTVLPGLAEAITRESTPGRSPLDVALTLAWKPQRGPGKGKSIIDRLHEAHDRGQAARR